jgi:hypothetical protein
MTPSFGKVFIIDPLKINKMEIIDRQFLRLPRKKQVFVFVIVAGFMLVGLIAYISNLINLVSAFFIILIGILFGEIIKLSYRIENLERKK